MAWLVALRYDWPLALIFYTPWRAIQSLQTILDQKVLTVKSSTIVWLISHFIIYLVFWVWFFRLDRTSTWWWWCDTYTICFNGYTFNLQFLNNFDFSRNINSEMVFIRKLVSKYVTYSWSDWMSCWSTHVLFSDGVTFEPIFITI